MMMMMFTTSPENTKISEEDVIKSNCYKLLDEIYSYLAPQISRVKDFTYVPQGYLYSLKSYFTLYLNIDDVSGPVDELLEYLSSIVKNHFLKFYNSPIELQPLNIWRKDDKVILSLSFISPSDL